MTHALRGPADLTESAWNEQNSRRHNSTTQCRAQHLVLASCGLAGRFQTRIRSRSELQDSVMLFSEEGKLKHRGQVGDRASRSEDKHTADGFMTTAGTGRGEEAESTGHGTREEAVSQTWSANIRVFGSRTGPPLISSSTAMSLGSREKGEGGWQKHREDYKFKIHKMWSIQHLARQHLSHKASGLSNLIEPGLLRPGQFEPVEPFSKRLCLIIGVYKAPFASNYAELPLKWTVWWRILIIPWELPHLSQHALTWREYPLTNRLNLSSAPAFMSQCRVKLSGLTLDGANQDFLFEPIGQTSVIGWLNSQLWVFVIIPPGFKWHWLTALPASLSWFDEMLGLCFSKQRRNFLY